MSIIELFQNKIVISQSHVEKNQWKTPRGRESIWISNPIQFNPIQNKNFQEILGGQFQKRRYPQHEITIISGKAHDNSKTWRICIFLLFSEPLQIQIQ